MKDELQWSCEIIDPAGFYDFRDAMADYAPQVERLVAQLGDSAHTGERVTQLFRILHTIKGDASLCQVGFVEPFVHALEGLLEPLRVQKQPYHEVVGDVLLLVLDRLEMALEAIANDDPLDDLRLPVLLHELQDMPEQPEQSLAHCGRLVAAMTGMAPPPEPVHARPAPSSAVSAAQADLGFFRALALQLECRMSQFAGRTERNLALALDTVRAAGVKVDLQQLEAAVYMHDIGMMLLPEKLWLRPGRLDDEERRQLSAHPAWAAGLLSRMKGWEGAALMVAQHHEIPNGRGYPEGLTDGEICDGARILALVDAFEAVMLKHAQRGQRRSVLRAVAELNACELQFDARWLAPFNQVVRSRLEAIHTP